MQMIAIRVRPRDLSAEMAAMRKWLHPEGLRLHPAGRHGFTKVKRITELRNGGGLA